MRITIWWIALPLLIVMNSIALAADISDEDVKSHVAKAVMLIKNKGDEALKEIGKKEGEFHQGELYVFVYDENVTMLAHPVKPTLVGKNFKGKPDIQGKAFRDEIVENALTRAGVWEELKDVLGQDALSLNNSMQKHLSIARAIAIANGSLRSISPPSSQKTELFY